ncbi:MAG: class I SAM-dependent methyltransferase [Desulforhopalus sp.]
MHKDEIIQVFEKQASGYDSQWLNMAPIYESLFFFLDSIFAELSNRSRLLCVGVGTGKELIHLARKNPGWTFTAVEPSKAMLDVCRSSLEEEGLKSRCDFHEGYLETLPNKELYNGATCCLVSQFVLERENRSAFFNEISKRLRSDAILINADLSVDINSEKYEDLLRLWYGVMSARKTSSEDVERMKVAYSKSVAMLPPDSIASIIKEGGFKTPIHFFQAGLIHAWFAKNR